MSGILSVDVKIVVVELLLALLEQIQDLLEVFVSLVQLAAKGEV